LQVSFARHVEEIEDSLPSCGARVFAAVAPTGPLKTSG
jgi:hypothetical protein